MTLKAICNREVLVASKDESVLEAAKLMREYHCGDIVVIEDKDGIRVPASIVTDRDIVIELIAQEVDINSVSVGDLPTRELVVANEDDDVVETIKMMRQKGIRRLPVVDGTGALIGIVALDDLIDLIAEQLKDLAALIGNEQTLEKKYR